jgi:hypothetical protein
MLQGQAAIMLQGQAARLPCMLQGQAAREEEDSSRLDAMCSTPGA